VAGKNARDRYANHSQDQACRVCHNFMDPIGFSWEKYDASGKTRTFEKHPSPYGEIPIDTKVTMLGLKTFATTEAKEVNNIIDVAHDIGASERGPKCLSLQYYRYISGDTHSNIENNLVVKKINDDFKSKGYELKALFLNIVSFKSFITRIGR
jgi:hypothetical protein